MSSYLRSLSERPTTTSDDPRILDLSSDEASDVLGALSSDTARDILIALHEQPATLSEIADEVGTSRQNAQYHIKKLKAAEAVETIDTWYSEKGREMKVYAPTAQPLVIVSGDETSQSRLRTAVNRLFGGVALLGVASLVVQAMVERFSQDPQPVDGEWVLATNDTTTGDQFTHETDFGTFTTAEGEEIDLDGDHDVVFEMTGNLTRTDGDTTSLIAEPLIAPARSLFEVYPGLVFFLGGVVMLLLMTVWMLYTPGEHRY